MSLDWLADIGKASVGGVVALGGQALLRRLSKHDERRRRAEERSEEAATEVLGVLDEARDQFRWHTDHQKLPGYDDTKDLVTRIRAASVFILDSEVRKRLDLTADALSGMLTLANWGEGFPAQITYTLWHQGRLTLGAMLRGEPLPTDRSDLDRYATTIEADWRDYEEHMEQERARIAEERQKKRER